MHITELVSQRPPVAAADAIATRFKTPGDVPTTAAAAATGSIEVAARGSISKDTVLIAAGTAVLPVVRAAVRTAASAAGTGKKGLKTSAGKAVG